MEKCDFFDLENIDGFVSGTVFLYANNKRYILDFGYDKEFSSLKIMNCNNQLYNSNGDEYASLDELS